MNNKEFELLSEIFSSNPSFVENTENLKNIITGIFKYLAAGHTSSTNQDEKISSLLNLLVEKNIITKIDSNLLTSDVELKKFSSGASFDGYFLGVFSSFEELKEKFPSSKSKNGYLSLVKDSSKVSNVGLPYIYSSSLKDWIPLGSYNGFNYAVRKNNKIEGRENGTPLDKDIVSYDFQSKSFKPFSVGELDLASKNFLNTIFNSPITSSYLNGRISVNDNIDNLKIRNLNGITEDSFMISLNSYKSLIEQINKDYSRKILLDFDSKNRPFVVRSNEEKIKKVINGKKIEVYEDDYEKDSLINFNIDRPTFEKLINRINNDYAYFYRKIKSLTSGAIDVEGVEVATETNLHFLPSSLLIPKFKNLTPITVRNNSFNEFSYSDSILLGFAVDIEDDLSSSFLLKNLDILFYENTLSPGTTLYLAPDNSISTEVNPIIIGYVIDSTTAFLNFSKTENTVVNKTTLTLEPNTYYEFAIDSLSSVSLNFYNEDFDAISSFEIFKTPKSFKFINKYSDQNLGVFIITNCGKLFYKPHNSTTLTGKPNLKIKKSMDISNYEIFMEKWL